jgi:hypothetical protein
VKDLRDWLAGDKRPDGDLEDGHAGPDIFDELVFIREESRRRGAPWHPTDRELKRAMRQARERERA